MIFRSIGAWIEKRKQIRLHWQNDARALVKFYGRNAYYEAQRRAAGARARHDHPNFWHWAKVASEVARLSPAVEMDMKTVQAIADDELNRRRENK